MVVPLLEPRQAAACVAGKRIRSEQMYCVFSELQVQDSWLGQRDLGARV